jgi:O-antigen/teichoic acid export membrane protein
MSAMLAKNKGKESLKYIDITMMVILMFVNAVAFGIIAVGKNFSVIFYGADFEKSGQIMACLAVTIIFLGVGNVIRTQYLIPMQLDKIYIISAILGAVVNFVVNFMLIGKYKSMGAAIGTICAEFAVCAYQMYGVRKSINLKKYCQYEIVFLLFAVIMFIAIKLLDNFASGILLLILQIIVGAIVYSILCFFYLVKTKK